MKAKSIGVLLVVMLVLAAVSLQVGLAQGDDGEPITVQDGCMEEVALESLNCTANDVQLAQATGILITDPCEYPGDEVTFTATFEVLLTAQERHDIGIYFAIDGDGNFDGALTGQCSISTLPYDPDPPWLDLDGTGDPFPTGKKAPSGIQDVCGDIDGGHNPLYPEITITAVCSDPDGDGFLNLPYCTSWRQPGSNVLCEGPLDAYPGAPSKCKCDMNFNVPVPVPPAELLVTKTAGDAADGDIYFIDEPGGDVAFTVTVENTGIDPDNSVTLASLLDDIYGDITSIHDDISDTNCILATIDPGTPYTCSFTAAVTGNAGDVQTDIVTAEGDDERLPTPNHLTGFDAAVVELVDVPSAMHVVKTAGTAVDGAVYYINEPGGTVTFHVTVYNDSTVDLITINTLNDAPYGDITYVHDDIESTTCSVPQPIPAGGSYSCSFEGSVTGNAGDIQTDTVTASGVDDDGTNVSDDDAAVVELVDVPSAMHVVKTAGTAVDGAVYYINEPGGPVTFHVTVYNDSTVDLITINTLNDAPYGDITYVHDDIESTTCSVSQPISAGGSYSCSFEGSVTGNAGEIQPDTVTASGADDDGTPVSDSDDATVTILNVDPAASLTKTVTQALVTFKVVVSNESTSSTDPLTIDSLVDDQYGDLNGKGDCSVPQTIQQGDKYSCSFEALVTTSPQTDIVTGTLSDDDGSDPLTPSDSATVSWGE
jgi:hypothetical protein